MAGVSTFLSLLCLIGFFAATWTASKISRLVGVPALMLEIGSGILFGPQVVRLMDPKYAVCQSRHFSKECQLPPNIDELLAKGLPLGPTLGRIAHSGYCPARVYVPGLLQRNPTAWRDRRQNATSWNGSNGTARVNATALAWGRNATKRNVTATAVNASRKNVSNVSNASMRSSSSSTKSALLEGAAYKECLRRSCEADLTRTCEQSPDLFTMIGHAGVGLLVFENALHFDFHKLKAVGPWGWLVALVGSVVPMVTGFALVALYGRPLVPDAVLAGAAMVPSSTHVISRLLRRVQVAEEGFGQLALTAALVDNVVALLLFDIFFSLGGQFDGFRMVGSPIIGSILVVCAMAAAVFVWPKMLQEVLLPRIPKFTWDPKVSLPDDTLFVIMLGILVLYAWIMHLLGNFLWGCFIAGMSFACLVPQEQIRQGWARQAKVLTAWMVRIFYACTVAFAIPVDVLFHGEAFWKGTLLGFFPCILAKVVSACFLGETRFLIGWLMVGRAELAFFIASMSATAGMMDPKTYCIVIWALLWANLLGPVLFRVAFARFARGPHSAETRELSFSSLGGGAGQKVAASAGWDDRLGSLSDIDLEELAKYPLPSDETAPAAPAAETLEEAAAAAAAAAEKKKKGGGLLCCLFFREVGVH